MEGTGLTPQDRKTKADLPSLLDARRRIRKGNTLLPHAAPGPHEDLEQRVGVAKSGAIRAAIFGVNDGLVSNAALIMGFAGASVDRGVILLAGVAGLLAGAFSMGAGEYVSMRVQRELFERLIHLEAHELGNEPEEERRELAEIYERKGIPSDLADQVATAVMRDPQVALDTHAREELGLDPEDGLGSPWSAAISSFLTFALGAFVPLMPFLFASGGGGTAASAFFTAVALLIVGGLTSLLTARSPVLSALRMLAIGGGAALVTYLVGSLLGVGVVD